MTAADRDLLEGRDLLDYPDPPPPAVGLADILAEHRAAVHLSAPSGPRYAPRRIACDGCGCKHCAPDGLRETSDIDAVTCPHCRRSVAFLDAMRRLTA